MARKKSLGTRQSNAEKAHPGTSSRRNPDTLFHKRRANCSANRISETLRCDKLHRSRKPDFTAEKNTEKPCRNARSAMPVFRVCAALKRLRFPGRETIQPGTLLSAGVCLRRFRITQASSRTGGEKTHPSRRGAASLELWPRKGLSTTWKRTSRNESTPAVLPGSPFVKIQRP